MCDNDADAKGVDLLSSLRIYRASTSSRISLVLQRSIFIQQVYFGVLSDWEIRDAHQQLYFTEA